MREGEENHESGRWERTMKEGAGRKNHEGGIGNYERGRENESERIVREGGRQEREREW